MQDLQLLGHSTEILVDNVIRNDAMFFWYNTFWRLFEEIIKLLHALKNVGKVFITCR